MGRLLIFLVRTALVDIPGSVRITMEPYHVRQTKIGVEMVWNKHETESLVTMVTTMEMYVLQPTMIHVHIVIRLVMRKLFDDDIAETAQ